MTIEESILVIKGLLNRFPAVRIVWDHRTQLVLNVGSHDSLVVLARCCLGANVPLSVVPADTYRDQVAAPGHDELRYVLTLSHDPPWVEALGVFLVKALLKRQLIDLAE